MKAAICFFVFIFLNLFINDFVFADDSAVPDQIREASHAVFQHVNIDGSTGSGFFLGNNETFVIAFHSILYSSLYASQIGQTSGLGITVNVDGKELKVKEIKSMSILHDQIILKVEGYEGPFLKLSNTQMSDNDEVYVLGFPQDNTDVAIVRGRIDPNLRVNLSHIAFSDRTFFSDLYGMSGGPMLDKNGRVIGVYSESTGAGDNVHIIHAQQFLTHLLRENLGITNSASAVSYFEKRLKKVNQSARRKNVLALYTTGSLSWMSARVTDDKETKLNVYLEALKSFKIAANKGHMLAQSRLANILGKGYEGILVDKERSAFWLRKLSKQGDARSQLHLAKMLLAGDGIPKDVSQAVNLFRELAERGNAEAQQSLFVIYSKGYEDIPVDKVQALSWLHRWTESVDVNTRFDIGLMVYYGYGDVPRDVVRGEALVREAAEQGHYAARALYYTEGGMPQNISQALELINKVSSQSDVQSQDSSNQQIPNCENDFSN